MNALTSFASTPVVQSVGWTLLHFLWQGCLITGILAVVLLLLRKRSAEARYAASCLAMLLMAAVPIVTFVPLAGPPAGWFAGSDVPQAVFLVASGETHQQTVIKTALPYVVATWLVGVVLLLIRLTGGWFQVQRLKREMLCNPDGGWQETVDRLSRRLGLRSIVESAAASVPTVIGWIRPIILMPVAAVCGLSPQQLEVVIAHELAHIRRHDYLVNLLQSVMETLLFYHPGVWWVSGRMREEREYCCDDLAVAVCGDPLRYAHVLTDLETLRGATLHLGLSSTGGSLMNRVTRLVGLHAARSRRGSLWILTAFAITAAAGVASVAGHSLIGASDDADAPKAVMVKLDLQTVGEEGEGHFIWVTTDAAEGEQPGVWVLTQTAEGKATVQVHLAREYAEGVDQQNDSEDLSLLGLAHRYLSHFIARQQDDEQGNTFIGHLERLYGDNEQFEATPLFDDNVQFDATPLFGEATRNFTFEVEQGEFRVPHLLRFYVQFGELHLIADQIDIEIEPTVETGQLIEVRPVISEDRKGILLELQVEPLHEVDEEGETPLTVTLESRGMLGMLLRDHGDAEDAERLRYMHFDVVRPTVAIQVGKNVRQVSWLQRYRTIAVRDLLETTAEYDVLREIYVDAKEGEEAEVKVLIKVEEDESGDQ